MGSRWSWLALVLPPLAGTVPASAVGQEPAPPSEPAAVADVLSSVAAGSHLRVSLGHGEAEEGELVSRSAGSIRLRDVGETPIEIPYASIDSL